MTSFPATVRSGRRTRIFIDYWNFQLSWNERSKEAGCDWRALPLATLTAAGGVLAGVGLAEPLELDETLLYASVDPLAAARLRNWLETFVNRLPSWRVTIRERRERPRSVHCRACGHDAEKCPQCNEPYVARPEKGVDTAIVTDLLSLAWQDAFDIAILVTSDADFIPAVERVQEKGLKVINAAWQGKGHDLKAACWASFDLDSIAATIRR
jgi:hypothetical protein